MEKKIIFNHIPKTGGTSLRIILNRIYGLDKVYFIKSTDLGDSLQSFSNLSIEQQKNYEVIAGHGAEKFSHFVEEPIRIIILRDPVDLFLSQYYYLRVSPNSIFQKQINQLKTIDDYLDFATENGQDNLITRYLSNSIDWLFDSALPIPDLNIQGNKLLEKAKENLNHYDAVLGLETFDTGVYSLSKHLKWKKIPLYKPSNKNSHKPDFNFTNDFLERLKVYLRFDIELYSYFLKENLDIANKANQNSVSYKLFLFRQEIINKLFKTRI